jgi:hypothetical protein
LKEHVKKSTGVKEKADTEMEEINEKIAAL